MDTPLKQRWYTLVTWYMGPSTLSFWRTTVLNPPTAVNYPSAKRCVESLTWLCNITAKYRSSHLTICRRWMRTSDNLYKGQFKHRCLFGWHKQHLPKSGKKIPIISKTVSTKRKSLQKCGPQKKYSPESLPPPPLSHFLICLSKTHKIHIHQKSAEFLSICQSSIYHQI